MIYYTADPHFGHRNILAHCNRPFSSVEEMDKALIYHRMPAVSTMTA